MSRKTIQVKAPKNVDQELLAYLKTAEEALINAVELFIRKSDGKIPERQPDVLKRLTRAQEGVTSLLREELVRDRGIIKVSFKRRTK